MCLFPFLVLICVFFLCNKYEYNCTVFLTSVSPFSELLKQVVLGVLELCGISGTVTAHLHQPLIFTWLPWQWELPKSIFLLCWVLGNTPKHDAGQHGAEEQGEAAGHPLDAGEVAPSWAAEDGIPNVSVLEAHGGLHEEQVAVDGQGERDSHLRR